MTIPNVNREQLLEAIEYFDGNLRAAPAWQGCEDRDDQQFALSHNNRLYPLKRIIGLASGLSDTEFPGGDPACRFLEKQGFSLARINDAAALLSAKPLPSFVIGQIYDRFSEINDIFGGSRQSGIAPSRRAHAIFLFTGRTGEKYGYTDYRDDQGVYWYSGEGQLGDMVFKSGNKAVRDHAQNGQALHLFKSLGKARGQKYLGEHTCGVPKFERGIDKERRERDVIVFPLIPVNLAREIEQSEDSASTPRLATTLDEARRLALWAVDNNTESQGATTALRNLYRRSQLVRNYVLQRAAGLCELCNLPAPFRRRDGSGYLEPHHTNRLSDGGLDHPRFVAAICPTCHRHIHYGKGGNELNKRLTLIIADKETNS
ncbi:HNH endonuclease [Cupriavidus sp. 2KB_3]|uniref:HNH endonuclease n=1 Tax=Cupriavidus TaxID=106589 RepID=UPI0021CC94F6|nr:HNH endonuclease [Cupriavidus campinensis]